jgi:hypothetical protein
VSRCRRSPRNEKVGLSTTLITRLLSNPLAKSRSTADASVQSSPEARPPHRLTIDGMEGQSSSPKLHLRSRYRSLPFKIMFRQDSVTR